MRELGRRLSSLRNSWHWRLGGCLLALASILLLPDPGFAQQRQSYTLSTNVVNQGGAPEDRSSVPSSSGYSLGYAAIGEGILRVGMASASYQMDVGFLTPYAPPGEVAPCDGPMGVPCSPKLEFTSKEDMEWPWAPWAVRYNLYRGVRDDPGLFDPNYGQGLECKFPTNHQTDKQVPNAGEVLFYLVTGDNRLHEEGTKGWDTFGTERPNPTGCP